MRTKVYDEGTKGSKGRSMCERASKIYRGFKGDIGLRRRYRGFGDVSSVSGMHRRLRRVVEVLTCTEYVRGGLRIISVAGTMAEAEVGHC